MRDYSRQRGAPEQTRNLQHGRAGGSPIAGWPLVPGAPGRVRAASLSIRSRDRLQTLDQGCDLFACPRRIQHVWNGTHKRKNRQPCCEVLTLAADSIDSEFVTGGLMSWYSLISPI